MCSLGRAKLEGVDSFKRIIRVYDQAKSFDAMDNASLGIPATSRLYKKKKPC